MLFSGNLRFRTFYFKDTCLVYSLKMSSIKLELDEYLARKDDTKPLLKNGIGLPGVSLPKVGNWFKREPSAEEGWFSETQKDCCPKMVNIPYI